MVSGPVSSGVTCRKREGWGLCAKGSVGGKDINFFWINDAQGGRYCRVSTGILYSCHHLKGAVSRGKGIGEAVNYDIIYSVNSLWFEQGRGVVPKQALYGWCVEGKCNRFVYLQQEGVGTPANAVVAKCNESINSGYVLHKKSILRCNLEPGSGPDYRQIGL